MRIQFSAGQPRNTVINAARVNASFAKEGCRQQGKSGEQGQEGPPYALAPGEADEHDRQPDKAEAVHHGPEKQPD